MKFDIFFSICQTDVDGYMPSERIMFENFFDQIQLADQLGFGTAWIAETHLSCEIQKQNTNAVIPHFKGEIGLNTDVLQIAHKVFGQTKNIHIGSAIRNILCNGGPIAHAEAIRTFLTFHGLNKNENRLLNIGFATGRFEFSNRPYGIIPRNNWENIAWPVLKGKIFQEATEIFLRLLKGELLSSQNISPRFIDRTDFRTEEHWQKTLTAYGKTVDKINIPAFWNFEKLGVIPREAPMHLLRLILGTHDPKIHTFANKIYPCGVFNLSITPLEQIEETHQRMKLAFHPDGGAWKREYMPRTVLVFINEDNKKAKAQAEKAIANYWKAMEGTLDERKVQSAVSNALAGSAHEIIEQMKSRFNKDDRLMLWFDFNNHNNNEVKQSMRSFMEKIAPAFV